MRAFTCLPEFISRRSNKIPLYASRDLNCQVLIATKKRSSDPFTLEETQRGCFPRNSCGIFSALSKGNNLAISAWNSGNGDQGVEWITFVNTHKVIRRHIVSQYVRWPLTAENNFLHSRLWLFFQQQNIKPEVNTLVTFFWIRKQNAQQHQSLIQTRCPN